MEYGLIEIIAVIVVAIVFIIKPVLARFFPSASEKFKKYYPYAMQAFAWVEKNIPDDFGIYDKDPTYAKMAHKADMFIKKFTEFSIKENGKAPNEEMIKEAKNLASYLASKK